MVVDALLVDRVDLEPRDTCFILEADGDVAHHIFDEDRVVVRLHGDVSFISALEQGVDRCRGRGFSDLDQLLDPDHVGLTLLIVGDADFDGHVSTLVVCAIIADGLAARTQARDGDFDGEDEVITLTVGGTFKRALVIHQRRGFCDWGFAFEKVGEGDLDVRGLSVKFLFEVVKDRGECPHRHFISVAVEDLDEATHVCAFELLWEGHGHAQFGDRLLFLFGLVEDDDGVTEAAHADLIDGDLSFISLVLYVLHLFVFSTVDTPGGACFIQYDLAEGGQLWLEFVPDPPHDIFTGGVGEAFDLVEIVVIELLVQGAKCPLELREVDDPSGLAVHFV